MPISSKVSLNDGGNLARSLFNNCSTLDCFAAISSGVPAENCNLGLGLKFANLLPNSTPKPGIPWLVFCVFDVPPNLSALVSGSGAY